MAKYTVELNDLLKNEETNALIQKALNSYPMYEPIHKELYGYIPTREELNKKIVDHYRFYEIGSETPGRFFYNLEMAMNEIMPKYNQLYKSVDIMNGVEDIFGNLDVEETYEQKTEGNSSSQSTDKTTGDSTGTSKSDVTSKNTTNTEMNDSGRNVGSKTPQSQLAVKSIENITAASEINWNENTSSSKSTSDDTSSTEGSTTNKNVQESKANASSESTGKVSHTLKRKGNQGVNTYAHDMLEFRQLFLNIEQQIINDPELATCFMLIW